jgi:glycosyltransferase involved in cell wall biosynthesis
MKDKPQKHKILFIDSGKGYGGSSKFLYYLLCHLDRKRFEPLIAFYFYNDGPDTERIRDLGIPVFFLNNKREPSEYVPISWLLGKSEAKLLHEIKVILRFSLRMVIIELPIIWRLVRLIKREAIALIILNNDVHYHLAGTLGARITGIPCICRKTGGIGEGRRIKKLLVPYVDLFIAISKATAEDQRRNNPSTKRLVTIYEGIDLKAYTPLMHNPNIKKHLGIPLDKKIVCNISRFNKGKGQMELIEAAALILKKYRDVIFLMVGDGELIRDLQERVKRLNLTDYVFFTGWRNDILKILSVVDIFVHCPTTWIEGLGIANLEAMAMAKPTVVSNNGGLPDAVIDSVTGFVVPSGDIYRLSETILKLLEDEELAFRFGRNARKRVEEEFDMEKNVRKLEALFEEYI